MEFIASHSGSPGSRRLRGAMATSAMSPFALCSRTVILVVIMILVCVSRGVASDEAPDDSGEVIHTLWEDDNPEFRDVTLDEMDEGVDTMDRDARKITRAQLSSLIRKKQKAVLDLLPPEERAKKKAEERARSRQELESRLRRRNDKPMKIVSPFFRDDNHLSETPTEGDVGPNTLEEVVVAASAPRTTIQPENVDTSSSLPTSTVSEEEHIALPSSETTIEPAISTYSASESQQTTGAPAATTEGQQLKFSDAPPALGSDTDVTIEEDTSPTPEIDLITENITSVEVEPSTTSALYVGRITSSTLKSTTSQPSTPESWIDLTTPEPWNDTTDVPQPPTQPATPQPWTEQTTPESRTQPATPAALWTETSTPEIRTKLTTPEPWTESNTPGASTEANTPEPRTEQNTSEPRTNPSTHAPEIPKSTTPEKITPEVINPKPTRLIMTTPEPTPLYETPMELTTPKLSNPEITSFEITPSEPTWAHWTAIPAPRKSTKSFSTARQSIDQIVGHLEKLLSVTEAPSDAPIKIQPTVNGDTSLLAAQQTGKKPNTPPPRLSSAAYGMSEPDYADHALQSDVHPARLHPTPSSQIPIASGIEYNAPRMYWNGAPSPGGFQESIPSIQSVAGYGPRGQAMAYSKYSVPHYGDIDMIRSQFVQHSNPQAPSFVNPSGPYGSEVYRSAQENTQTQLRRTYPYPVPTFIRDASLPFVPNQTYFGFRPPAPAQQATGPHPISSNRQYNYQATGREVQPQIPTLYAGPFLQVAQGVAGIPTPRAPSELPRMYNIEDNIIEETPYEKQRAKAFEEWKDALRKKKEEAAKRAYGAGGAATTPPWLNSPYVTPGTAGVPTVSEFERILQEASANAVTLPAVRPPRPQPLHRIQKRQTAINSAYTPTLEETRLGSEGMIVETQSAPNANTPYVTPGTEGVPTVSEFEQNLQESSANAVQLPAVRPPRPKPVRRIQKKETTINSAYTPSLEETRLGLEGMVVKAHSTPHENTPYVTPGAEGVPTVSEFERNLQESSANAVQLPAVRPPRPQSLRRIQKRHTTIDTAYTPPPQNTRHGSDVVIGKACTASGMNSAYLEPGTDGVPSLAEFEQILEDSKVNCVQLPLTRPPRPGTKHFIQKRDTTIHSSHTPSLEVVTKTVAFRAKDRPTYSTRPAPYLQIHEDRETSTKVIPASGNHDEMFHVSGQPPRPIMTVLPPNRLHRSNDLQGSYHSGEEVDARPFKNSSQNDVEGMDLQLRRFASKNKLPELTNATIMRIVFPPLNMNSGGSFHGDDYPDSNYSSSKKYTWAQIDGIESPMLTALLRNISSERSHTVIPPSAVPQFGTSEQPPASLLSSITLKREARDCDLGKCKTCQSRNCVHSWKGENERHLRRKRCDHVLSDSIFAHQLSLFGS